MTAKQKANRERFKKAIAEAAKIRAKNPKLTQAEAVKKAWAIIYSKKRAGKVGAVKKAAKKSPRKSECHKDTHSHNVRISVVSGIKTTTQAGAILNIYIKRSLKKAGFNVPTEIATNDLKKIYKTIFGKNPPDISKIKRLLKKHGYNNAELVFKDLN